MANNYNIKDNIEAKQFELEIDGHTALIEYIIKEEKIYLIHTEVPKVLSGKGIGSTLVKLVLEEIENRNMILIPNCPFVAAYIKKNPGWKRLLTKRIND